MHHATAFVTPGELQPMDLSVNGDFKVIVKEQFTQWYAGRDAANPKEGNKETVDLRISVMKPIHARWIVSAFDMVAKDSIVITCRWRLAGFLTK